MKQRTYRRRLHYPSVRPWRSRNSPRPQFPPQIEQPVPQDPPSRTERSWLLSIKSQIRFNRLTMRYWAKKSLDVGKSAVRYAPSSMNSSEKKRLHCGRGECSPEEVTQPAAISVKMGRTYPSERAKRLWHVERGETCGKALRSAD